jgi:hypothetical protein
MSSFLQTTYKLRDWIPIEKLDSTELSLNLNAIDLLKQNPEKLIGKLYQ